MQQTSSQASPATPPAVSQVLRRLKTILAADLDLHVPEAAIGDTVSLMEGGLALDSVVLIELIQQVETQFDFQWEDQSLRPELFENLTVLAEFIADRQARRS
jgi:acyl carrier protein